MILGRPKTYTKKIVNKWSPPKREPAQEEPKLSKIPPGGHFAAPRVCFGEFWVLLGPAPFLAVTIFLPLFEHTFWEAPFLAVTIF